MMEDKLSSLPQQLVSFREYISKSLVNLHQRTLQSDLTLGESIQGADRSKDTRLLHDMETGDL